EFLVDGQIFANKGLKKLEEFYIKDEDKNYWLNPEKKEKVEKIIKQYHKTKLKPHYDKVEPFVSKLLLVLLVIGIVVTILFNANLAGRSDVARQVAYTIDMDLNCIPINITDIDNKTIYRDKNCRIVYSPPIRTYFPDFNKTKIGEDFIYDNIG
ncbi:MAG: hypothetical protein AABX90_01855, partial [Nanoarchaeota archaeon]